MDGHINVIATLIYEFDTDALVEGTNKIKKLGYAHNTNTHKPENI